MIISQYFHSIPMDDSHMAVFNSLLLEPLFVSKREFDSIIHFTVGEGEKKILFDKGIYISSAENDTKALSALQKRYAERCYRIETLYLCVSDLCNLSCDYCFVNNCADADCALRLMTKDIADITLSKWLDYLGMFQINEPTIVFYGGEPLLNVSLIKYVVEKTKILRPDMRFQIVTNGTLIDDDIINFVKSNEVELGISIDGPPRLNDKHRYYTVSNRSVGKDVEENILKCLKNNCNVGLSIAITEDVLNQQDDVLRWISNIGVRGVYFNILQSTSTECYSESYYRRANTFLQRAYDNLGTHIQEGSLLRKINSFYNAAFKLSNCSAVGVNQLTITSNGGVCVCQGCTRIKKHACGNILSDSFEKILSSDLSSWIFFAPVMNEKCQSCNAIFICGGGCPLETESLVNTAEGIDWPFCIHSQSSLEWLLKSAYTKEK